jgi:ribonuclease I
MAFIKIEEVVINTSYIAAVRLESYALASENRVSLLVAIPTPSLLQQEMPSQSLYHYEWMEFTGDAAKALRDYFSSFNNVIDLLPQDRSPVCCGNSQLRRRTHPR